MHQNTQFGRRTCQNFYGEGAQPTPDPPRRRLRCLHSSDSTPPDHIFGYGLCSYIQQLCSLRRYFTCAKKLSRHIMKNVTVSWLYNTLGPYYIVFCRTCSNRKTTGYYGQDIQCESKNPPLRGPDIFHFFTNGWEFLIDFLHTYYMFIPTLDYKFLFNYPQFWRSYVILSVTTQFT